MKKNNCVSRISFIFRDPLAFVIATALLVLVIAFCITGTVMSRTHIEAEEAELYFREQEKVWVADTRQALQELGYENSGVTLTRVVDEEGNREYRFTIHHKKIDRMEEAERADLSETLETVLPALEQCSFCHEFLMYES